MQIVFSDELGYMYYKDEDNLRSLIDLIAERSGKDTEVEIAYNDTNRPYEESFVDLEKIINMELTIEEDE